MVAPEAPLVDELLGEEEEVPPHVAAFAALGEALRSIPPGQREERVRQILAAFAQMHAIAEKMRVQKS